MTKTGIFGLLLVVLSALQGWTGWADFLPAQYLPMVTGAIGVIVLWLRSMTTEPAKAFGLIKDDEHKK